MLVIALSALAGALVFPLSALGRTSLLSVSKEWLLTLVGFWLVLTFWGLFYSMLLRSHLGLSRERALLWAALCHVPLLLCLSLVAALYSSDSANYAYAVGPYRLVYQPIAMAYVLAAPAMAEALLLAAYRWRTVAAWLPLATILLVALVLRAWNLGWALPALFHSDENHYVGEAFTILGNRDLNPHYFDNPSLAIYLDYLLILVLSPHVQAFHAAAHLFSLGLLDPRGDYLVDIAARAVSAGAGALTVVGVYAAGRDLFNRRSGLLAAVLLAVAFLHVRDSHYATNDVLATFLLTISFVSAVRIYTRGRATDYLLAGLFGGLAVSAKYNMGFFPAAILVAHALRLRSERISFRSMRHQVPLLAAGLASITGFVAGTPYSVLDFPSFVAGFRTQLGYGARPWDGQEAGIPLLMYLSTLLHGYGLAPLALSAVGVLLAARRHPARTALVLVIPVTYLLFMSTQQLFFVRFAITVLPFIAIPAGYAIDRISRRAASPRWAAAAACATLALAVVQPLSLSLRHDLLLGRADTRALAAAWIDANVPEESTIAVETYSQMDGRYGWPTGKLRGTSSFRIKDDQGMMELLKAGFDYVVVSNYGPEPWQHDAGAHGLLGPYSQLDEAGQLEARFGPGAGGADVPYSPDDDMCTPFRNLGVRERPGPTIWIYRLARVSGTASLP